MQVGSNPRLLAPEYDALSLSNRAPLYKIGETLCLCKHDLVLHKTM